MMRKVFPDYEALSRAASDYVVTHISTQLKTHQRCVVGLSTGATPRMVYQRLVKRLRQHPLDLSRLFAVNLDEYYPIQRTDPHSYYHWMEQTVWRPLERITAAFDYRRQAIIPDGETKNPHVESLVYEEKIRALGGIDLQILGVGENGHIGFNEPGSPGDSRTRLVDLTLSTRKANRRFFADDIDAVPKQAITMGIATILQAREILVIVSGKKKARIMKKIFSAKQPTSDIPATFLLAHPRVQWYLDAAAASLLP